MSDLHTLGVAALAALLQKKELILQMLLLPRKLKN